MLQSEHARVYESMDIFFFRSKLIIFLIGAINNVKCSKYILECISETFFDHGKVSLELLLVINVVTVFKKGCSFVTDCIDWFTKQYIKLLRFMYFFEVFSYM